MFHSWLSKVPDRVSLSSMLKVLCFGSLFVALMVLAGCSSDNNVVSDEAKVLLGVTGFAASTCSDSDGGENTFVKGTTRGLNNRGVSVSPTDACRGIRLTENYCGTNGQVNQRATTCRNACVDGACTPPVCGNRIKEGTEQCDDGNSVTTDACVSCKNARCGDSQVRAGVEQCDDGNTINNDRCSSICQTEPIPVCGNGIVEGVEACDDGNTINTDACTNVCQSARCGDAFVQAGEVCDDGNTVSGDGCRATCQHSCTDTDPGDDVLVVGSVEYTMVFINISSDVCLDSNYLNQQGCGAADIVTPVLADRVFADVHTDSDVFCGYNQCSGGVCTGTCTPGVTTTKCGINSAGRSYTENMTCRADGHSYVYGTYTVGASCPAGTVCGGGICQPATVVCGNGVVEDTEQCDDGNTIDGDGCSMICQYQCTETDGGYNLYIDGVVVGYNATNPTRLTRAQDWCVWNQGINELYCSGGLAAERVVTCPTGQSCTDGRCA